MPSQDTSDQLNRISGDGSQVTGVFKALHVIPVFTQRDPTVLYDKVCVALPRPISLLCFSHSALCFMAREHAKGDLTAGPLYLLFLLLGHFFLQGFPRLSPSSHRGLSSKVIYSERISFTIIPQIVSFIQIHCLIVIAI